MSDAMPDGELVKLPLPRRRNPHLFGDPVSVAATLARREQTERSCAICGAVKVTVHGHDGVAWREWRKSADAEQVTTEIACNPVIGAPA